MQTDLHFSRRELVNILELMDKCLHADSMDGVVSTLDFLHELIPFERAIICVVDSAEAHSNFFKHVFNHSYDQRWISTYLDGRYHAVDPVIAYALQRRHAFHWKAAYEAVQWKTGISREFTESAGDFGLFEGITHLLGADKSVSNQTLLSISLPCDIMLTRYLRMVEIVLPHIHQAIERVDRFCKLKTCTSLSDPLTPRELEVLKWASGGKTSWEISKILNISERTVKFHLSNIFNKLDVVNRSQAVAKALHHGLISN